MTKPSQSQSKLQESVLRGSSAKRSESSTERSEICAKRTNSPMNRNYKNNIEFSNKI